MTAEQRTNVRRYLEVKQAGTRLRKPIDGEKIKCEHCGSKEENLEWHHKLYWSEGGDDASQNLQVLCRPCQQVVHSEQDDFRKFGQWGGLVSAYSRERKLGRKKFCEEMKQIAERRWAA